MKLITFTIPCYNSQDYMRHCIDNIVAAGDEVEVIIVNDGSKDNTGKIADEYEKKYPTIVKAIQKENGGHGSGVMAGIRNATGLFFKVVDSDDWVETSDVLDMLNLIKKHIEEKLDVDLYITNYVYEHAKDNTRFVMHYRKCLPHEEAFDWTEMKRVKLETVLLMHSLMYRLDKLRESKLDLPNHTFYVDNIYAYVPLPFMKNVFYHDLDFYHYFIGREGQSIDYKTMCSRHEQQQRVFKIMFKTYNYDDLNGYPRHLRKYMWKYLMIIYAITIMTIVGVKEDKPLRKQVYKDFHKELKEIDERAYRKLRYHTIASFLINLPTYTLKSFMSRKVYGFYQRKLKIG